MTRLKKPLIAVLFALLCLSFVGVIFMHVGGTKVSADAATPVVYLDYGSSWKYNQGYIDDYQTVDVDGSLVTSSAWNTGNAPVGFAKYGQYELNGGTTLSNVNELHYIFTAKFTVDTLPNALSFGLYYDDAIALYLNGEEIYRDNVKGIDFTKLAVSDKVETTVGVAGEVTFNVVTDKIKTGENIVTAIVIEDFKGGNDAYFDMKISGVNDFEVDADQMPDTISLTPYDDPFTSRGVTFYTGYSLNTADVKYRKVGATEWDYVKSNINLPDDTEIWYGKVSHKVALTNLDENATYEYSLGSKVLDQWGKIYTFNTTSAQKALDGFKFYYITDTQSSNGWQFSIWQQLAAYIEANGETFDFFAHGGDIVESSVSATTLVPEQWSQGFNALESTMTSLPIVPVAGNHEYSAYAFYKHFNVKYKSFSDNGAYYSFDYGNAHFTIVNTNEIYFGNATEQLAWVKEDLTSTTKPWKIVMTHFALVDNLAYGYSDSMRQALMPIFAETGVDLVLSGHTHQYFRSQVYGHGSGLNGADLAETYQNLKDSVIPESQLVTYTDAVDGTIWTADPKGVTYLTAKSSNYNVYYQNLNYPTPNDVCKFATNPLNGKVMNGGTKGDDTGYLMNYMQYVSIEVTEDTLRCNVYNVKADTGETTLWDTYNVIKADSNKLDGMIENLPTVETVKASDFKELVKVYGLHGALGNDGISTANVSKIQALKAAITTQDALHVMQLNERIAALTVNDVDAFVQCQEDYDRLDADLQKYVDTTNMSTLESQIETQIKEATDKRAAASVTAELSKADALALSKLTEEYVAQVKEQYDDLTDDQKALVDNADVIENLEAKLKAAEVVDAIDGLKTAPNKADADSVYENYNELSAKEKTYVENYDLLVAIRERLAGSTDGAAGGNGGSLGLIIGLSAGGVVVVAGAVVLVIFLMKKKKGNKTV